MIIARIMGGLGNQMFQYAAARRLSIHHKTTLKLDLRYYEGSKSPSYGLNHFCIRESLATTREISAVKWVPRNAITKSKFIQRLLRIIEGSFRPSIFLERRLRPYDPNILSTPSDVYLDGYWQSEKYFAEIEDVIRSEFTFKDQLDPRSKEVAEEISKNESVSIHIRRGDFLSERKNRIFATCGLEYYQSCIALVSQKVNNAHLFVFSDDPKWARENLRPNCPTTFVTQEDKNRDYEEMRLMSLCKHNIIANSTFSWWGAWLNPNPNKIVLAPKKWFNDPSFDTRDLIPDGWRKV